MLTPGFQDMVGTVGRRVAGLRAERGLTQEQLAERLDMDRVSIGYIEQGRRAPKLSTLYRIAQVLDADMKDFFE